MKWTRDMFPATAKSNAIGAGIIAQTTAGMPRTLREVTGEVPMAMGLRMLAAQRNFAAESRTQAANRLRAVLLETDSAFKAQFNSPSPAAHSESGRPA